MGVNKSEKLCAKFGAEWTQEHYIPIVIESYKADKKGYNYRIICLKSLSIVIPIVHNLKDIMSKIIDIFKSAMKDTIPNV